MRPGANATDAPESFGQPVERLIQAARAGSREALGKLLEGYRRLLLAAAHAKIAPDLAAKVGASDLVQETFLEAQRDFPQFRGQTEKQLRHWLSRILDNNIKNVVRIHETKCRDRRREVSLDGTAKLEFSAEDVAATGKSPSSMASQREEEEILLQALARLAAHDQQVIRLRHLEQKEFGEIAELMNLPTADAARKRFSRAVERLRDQINQLRPRSDDPQPD